MLEEETPCSFFMLALKNTEEQVLGIKTPSNTLVWVNEELHQKVVDNGANGFVH